MEAFAIKIRKLREVYGYPQEYVAFQMGISQAAYSKKETGKTELSLIVLQQVSQLYDVPLTDLITLTWQDLVVSVVRKTTLPN